jgi:outer membrane PBP1 activator LpoA protein
VVVYDIGDESSLSSVYYDLALREGADFVVGPLGRKGVAALTENRLLTVPTLLLGQADLVDTANSNVFQFGLVPEQEAQQVAQDAISDGRRVAAVLYPDSDWGARMMSAFTEQFQTLGGSVVTAQMYTADKVVDQSIAIKRLLAVDDSERRRARVGAIVGIKPEFKARRRQDLDFIFLAGRSKAARLLKPQINFFQGQDLAVYATSHVFSGKFDRVNDADLNGVIFIDMPWMLDTTGLAAQRRQQIQGQWSGQRTGLDRLYAFGVDAYAVVRNLDALQRNPGQVIDGVSAQLTLNEAQRIDRSLSRAVFVDGVPKQMSTASASLDTRAPGDARRMPQTPVFAAGIVATYGHSKTPQQYLRQRDPLAQPARARSRAKRFGDTDHKWFGFSLAQLQHQAGRD